MKRPQPDIGDTLRGAFITSLGRTRKFKRMWGTTYVNGVEVLHNRRYYYPNNQRPDNFEELFRFLGAYKDVTASEPKGIKSAWVYLNKNKGTDLPVEDHQTKEEVYSNFVATNLNKLWWDLDDGPMPENLTLTTTLVIEHEFGQRINSTNLLDPNAPEEVIIEDIITNYPSLWSTCRITQQGVGIINKGSFTDEVTNVVTPDEDDLTPNDPWLATIARYVLRDSTIDYTVKKASVGYGVEKNNKYYNTYLLDIEIPYTEFTTNHPLVSKVVNDLVAANKATRITNLNRHKQNNGIASSNATLTREIITAMDASDLEDDPDLVSRSYLLWENESVEDNSAFSSIWLYANKTYYLKADALSNPGAYGVKIKDLGIYLYSLIDSGYKKKKVSWWKKALAIVVAAIVTWFFPPLGGWTLGIISVATFVVTLSLVLTLFTLAFTAMGNESMASAFAAASKAIEPLVMVASVILIVNTVQNSLAKAAKSVSHKTGKALADVTLSESVTELLTSTTSNLAEKLLDSVMEGFDDFMAGQVSAASIKFTDRILQLVALPQKLKLADLAEKNKDLKAEYEKLKEETQGESDVLQGFMNVYSKPATADWSMYAAEFDHPYERGGGLLHIGNVQRTTKQALRRGSYDDPAFDNILVV
jgi:hypothetical protein